VYLVTATVQSSSSASKARPTLMAGPRANGRRAFAASPGCAAGLVTETAESTRLLSLPMDAEGVAATAAQKLAAAEMARMSLVGLANLLSRETTIADPFLGSVWGFRRSTGSPASPTRLFFLSGKRDAAALVAWLTKNLLEGA
jgi:hypothetical protein